MNIRDYDNVLSLWKSIEGFYIREIDDSLSGMQKFLERNPSTNVVALQNDRIIGSILCGYDGRCAYLYHVCVHKDFRHQGIGSAMVNFVISALHKIDATHINLVAFKTNELGNLFWKKLEWEFKGTLNLYEYILDSKNIRRLNT
ncbi:GNAT family N-acetyltransferase [Helicobacter saguini]|uniref:GNAT family N-acetyltransferase n=2 Tax=Helicobacter saguini TaxID=1548018 RepID=A0A347W7I6_9HELI|nr:GNAT family N-acetyltransferase [Helicobacter saguini]MWV68258.1 GNAT family N-acetyltransferase [Helicobacter saguini]MWV70278.1 GNAT family N-acetyltransferase [Helicobacter saguini]MWV72180.1 GNAT family N-acetyltransferase [Helicobacter saguini]TLD95349.1 GNAT family N-acetyltransferase [Helicobacter saguini]